MVDPADKPLSEVVDTTFVTSTRLTGLSAAQVTARMTMGQNNLGGERTSRTVGEILRANILTRFNLILGTLFVAIAAVGQLRDALFGVVLIVNALIGIVQELRAKHTLDHLAVLNAPHATVIRDGAEERVPIDGIVLDDLVCLGSGDQIAADGVVRLSSGLQVDESLLTGESESVDKGIGAQVLSGSFVVAGTGRYQATAVGADAYARRLTNEARRFTPPRSDLIDGINRILRYVTWAIFPVAAILLVGQLHARVSVRDAVSGTVAGLVGMVPQGLILLTSIAFAVAAVSLARRNVLVQELPAIEGLARVDVVCFDKTGTLTDGSIVFDRIELVEDRSIVEIALGALAREEDANATLAAIGLAFPLGDGWSRDGSVPFSSSRKWGAASFVGHGTWVLGAPEMVLLTGEGPTLQRANELAATGQRVLVLAHSDARLEGETLPPELHAAALVLLAERVRDDAAATLAYFARQGVATKVISGDNPLTVAAVASSVGMAIAGQPVDARDLPDNEEALGKILEESSIFGRVTPRQKQAMVLALQAKGHTVAMTGDGVNDALALKLADIGVAMGSGSPATKAVAQIVLLDGSFATIPEVVAAGRKVTANIERVANIFIAKTVWATILALIVSVLLWPYPFLPRHLTIIDSLTIGIPSFFLALAPNLRRYAPGFVNRVLRFAIPTGFVVAASVFATFALARTKHLSLVEQRTAATLVTLLLSLTVLALMSLPLTWRRALLIGAVAAGFVLLFPLDTVRKFFALRLPTEILVATLVISVVAMALLITVYTVMRRRGVHADVVATPTGR